MKFVSTHIAHGHSERPHSTQHEVAGAVAQQIPSLWEQSVSESNAVKTAIINKRAGGMGLISGRKAFQKPMKDGVALLHAIQDVYLDSDVTLA